MRERIRKYRLLAKEAEQKAAMVENAKARSTFQGFADGWHHLADQVEAALRFRKRLGAYNPNGTRT